MSTAKQTSKNCNRIRFNDEQIKFLETMFETESRPEIRTKQQLANKLGLQPRQIAIWFQNRRARSKSRQLKRDYCVLKADYDNLSLKVETLKKENQTLLIQLQTLKKMDNKTDGEELENKDHFTIESSQNQRFLLEGSFMSPENERSFESCEFFDNTDTNSQWWNL